MKTLYALVEVKFESPDDVRFEDIASLVATASKAGAAVIVSVKDKPFSDAPNTPSQEREQGVTTE